MSVVVRPARPDELVAVGELTLAAYAADNGMPREHPYAAVLLDAAARDRAAALLVATDSDDHLLGTVTYVSPGTPFAEIGGPDEAEVRTLAVAPAARGRGVGRLLSDECVRRARAEGCSAVVLSSGTWMTAAHRLYERMGFVRTPALDWQPRPDVDLITFRLAL